MCSDYGASELFDKPLLGLVFLDPLEFAEGRTLGLPVVDAFAGAGKYNEEVHAINASRWVILNSEIDVLFNTETEVAYN